MHTAHHVLLTGLLRAAGLAVAEVSVDLVERRRPVECGAVVYAAAVVLRLLLRVPDGVVCLLELGRNAILLVEEVLLLLADDLLGVHEVVQLALGLRS